MIKFCINTQSSSISPIDRTLSGATTPRVDLRAMPMKRYSAFPKARALLEPHYQIVLCHILDTRWGLTSLQMRSQLGKMQFSIISRTPHFSDVTY